jgi:glutaredoxin
MDCGSMLANLHDQSIKPAPRIHDRRGSTESLGQLWSIPMHSLLCSLIALVFAAPLLAQTTTLYKSVAPDGSIVYSDQPNPKARQEKTLAFRHLPSSSLPPETIARIAQSQRATEPRSGAIQSAEAVLYSAVWCGYCTKAKAYLAKNKVPYREVDIDTKEGLASFVQAGGKKGVPFLVANGQTVSGYSPAAYDALLLGGK